MGVLRCASAHICSDSIRASCSLTEPQQPYDNSQCPPEDSPPYRSPNPLRTKTLAQSHVISIHPVGSCTHGSGTGHCSSRGDEVPLKEQQYEADYKKQCAGGYFQLKKPIPLNAALALCHNNLSDTRSSSSRHTHLNDLMVLYHQVMCQ